MLVKIKEERKEGRDGKNEKRKREREGRKKKMVLSWHNLVDHTNNLRSFKEGTYEIQ